VDSERWIRRFEAEGALGKALLVGGTAVRLTARALDRTLERAAHTLAEAEHAFKRELDPNIEEAKVLEERPNREPSGDRGQIPEA
jgi:hypothetical protein